MDWGLLLILATGISGLIGNIIDTHQKGRRRSKKKWYKKIHKGIGSLSTLGRLNALVLIILLFSSIIDYNAKKEETRKLVRENNFVKFSSLRLGPNLDVIIKFKNTLPFDERRRERELQARLHELEVLHEAERSSVIQSAGREVYDKVERDLGYAYAQERSYYLNNYFDSSLKEYLFPTYFVRNARATVQSDGDFFNQEGPIDFYVNLGLLFQFRLTIFEDGLSRPMISVTGKGPVDFNQDFKVASFIKEKSLDYQFTSRYKYNGGSFFEACYTDVEGGYSNSLIHIKGVKEEVVSGIDRSLDEIDRIYITAECDSATGTTMMVKYKVEKDYEYDEESKVYTRRIVHDGLPTIIDYKSWLYIKDQFPRSVFK